MNVTFPRWEGVAILSCLVWYNEISLSPNGFVTFPVTQSPKLLFLKSVVTPFGDEPERDHSYKTTILGYRTSYYNCKYWFITKDFNKRTFLCSQDLQYTHDHDVSLDITLGIYLLSTLALAWREDTYLLTCRFVY
jgi:hypothetical protein